MWIRTINTDERCNIILSIIDIIKVNLMLKDLFLLFLRFIIIGVIVILMVGVVKILLAFKRCAIEVARHYRFSVVNCKIRWLFPDAA